MPATLTPLAVAPRTPEAARKHDAHLAALARRLTPPAVVLLGDSITDGWTHPRRGAPPLRASFGGAVVPLGTGGDGVRNLLWRLEHGLAAALAANPPTALVVAIGANDDWPRLRPLFAPVLEAVAQRLRVACPAARLLLHHVLPHRDRREPDALAWRATQNAQITAVAATVGAAVLRSGDVLAGPDGWARPAMLTDSKHPSMRGYVAWAGALRHDLDALGIPLPDGGGDARAALALALAGSVVRDAVRRGRALVATS